MLPAPLLFCIHTSQARLGPPQSRATLCHRPPALAAPSPPESRTRWSGAGPIGIQHHHDFALNLLTSPSPGQRRSGVGPVEKNPHPPSKQPTAAFPYQVVRPDRKPHLPATASCHRNYSAVAVLCNISSNHSEATRVPTTLVVSRLLCPRTVLNRPPPSHLVRLGHDHLPFPSGSGAGFSS